MKPISVEDIAKLCDGKVLGVRKQVITRICIDSRSCLPGDLFVCVVGEKDDGHRYIKDAYEKGVRVFMVSNIQFDFNDAAYIYVNNTTEALCKMGEMYLNQYKIRKIGVTGSVGKTTTKMLTAAVLSCKYNTIATRKNLNTDLGVAITCFDVNETTQAAVFEMGMDKPGEIAGYVSRIKPDVAIITNVGISHLEKLGTRDAIADAKMEITSEFTDTNVLIVNSESDYLKTKKEIRERSKNKSNFVIISVGQDLVVSDIVEKGENGISFKINNVRFNLPLIGKHTAIDAALACAAGLQFGIPLEKAAKALAEVSATDKRLKVENISNIILIDDSYNASPDSVVAGIAAVAGVKARRKIVVLGDMLELGSESESGHIQVGQCVAESKIDMLIAFGANKDLYKKGLESVYNNRCSFLGFDKLEDAKNAVLSMVQAGDAVLVKGSNSTNVSEIAQAIREK